MLVPNKVTINCIWHAESTFKLIEGACLLLKLMENFLEVI